MSKKPLTILFDANPIVNGNRSGVGYYTYNLIQALADNYPDDIRLIGHYFNFLGHKDGASLPSAPNIHYLQSRIVPGKTLNITRRLGFQIPLEFFFRRKGDAALFTNYTVLPSISRIPRAFVVHDLCYIDHPKFVSKKNREFLQRFVPLSLKTAKLVITISEFTKASIQKHYGVRSDKIMITPIPALAPARSVKADLPGWVSGKFILFISTLEPRKNVINLVQAYELLPAAIKKDYALVLAGGQGWYMEETIDYIKQAQIRGERIIMPGYISDAEKAALYTHASLFVMPSHYEGFGMPILEAMSYGLPTAVSDLPVFHEVAADATVYFDKDDAGQISSILSKVLSDTSLQSELSRKGLERASEFSWQKTATALYERLASLR